MSSMSLKHEASVRKKYWFVNAFVTQPLKALKFLRNKKIWVFGSWNGQRYDDSPRYVYEYILDSSIDIHVFWITKNVDVYRKLKKEGKPVLLANTIEANKILLKCGVVFYTNGLDDISNLCLFKGACIINLNHTPIALKYLKYFNFEEQKQPIRLLKKIKRYLFNWFYFDYTIATSERSKKFWMSAFCDYDVSKYFLCGLPRNDILFLNTLSCFDPSYKYVVYLPTYRKYDNTIISDLVLAMKSDTDFMNLLKNNKVKIFIKPHFAEKLDLIDVNNEQIVFFDSNTSVSTQELLSIASILISDYSSCVIDFAVKNKPILIYAPDLEEYQNSNGISDDFKEIYYGSDVIKESNILISSLTANIKTPSKYELTEYLNKEYNQSGICPPYSKEVVRFAMEKVGLHL